MGTDAVMTGDHTRPDSETADEEEAEASRAHEADREPTEDEERAAERNTLDPAVAEHYKEATERGAAVKGEGEVS
jgi:hypothetical protein